LVDPGMDHGISITYMDGIIELLNGKRL